MTRRPSDRPRHDELAEGTEVGAGTIVSSYHMATRFCRPALLSLSVVRRFVRRHVDKWQRYPRRKGRLDGYLDLFIEIGIANRVDQL